MAAADHFEGYMVLVGAVIALAGVALGGWLESRREAARREYETEVRFHDERLNAYVAYMGATTTLFAAASVYVAGRVETANGFLDETMDTLGPYTAGFARVSMLAKPALARKLKDVHDYVMKLTKEQQPKSVVAEIVEDSLAARAAFELAAKDELGIS